MPWRRHTGSSTLRDVLARTAEGDPGCRRVLADAGRHIGVAAAGLVNLLNPEVIVVGGQLARSGEVLLGPTRGTPSSAVRFPARARA